MDDRTTPLPAPTFTLEQIAALPRPKPLSPQRRAELQAEVRRLAEEQDALILAHNYQLPEIQEVADFVGDSLALSRKAAAAKQSTIVFCGVHFMAETASVLAPDKTVLLPDPRAGCSLASSIDAAALAAWREEHPGAVVVMYVNTSAEVKALTDYCCTSANAVEVVRHVFEVHGEGTEVLFGPDMWLGAYVERQLGRPLHVWDGECHVHAGIRPDEIAALREAHPEAEFLIHPECGCTTSVMEYFASGEIGSGVHMLSTGGMLRYAERVATGEGPREVIVATEVGMIHPLQEAAPQLNFIPANPRAACAFMKLTTLERLVNSLRKRRYEVRVPEEIAAKARVPIERMIAIG